MICIIWCSQTGDFTCSRLASSLWGWAVFFAAGLYRLEYPGREDFGSSEYRDWLREWAW